MHRTCLRMAAMSALAMSALAAPARLDADTVIRKDGTRLECMVVSPVCPTCRGTQNVTCPVCNETGRLHDETCPRCNGRGKITCPTCGGLGYADTQISVLVKGGIRYLIPASEVSSVTLSDDEDEEDFLPPKVAYKAKAARVAANDVEGNLHLATWALEAGLINEAEVHFLRVRILDPARATAVDPFLSHIRRDREKRVALAVRSALEMIVRNRMKDAGAALSEILEKHPESELVRSPALQKEAIVAVLGESAPDWGSTLEKVADSLSRKLHMLCPFCEGTGSLECSQCHGTGGTKCSRCHGTGGIVCPDCNGTALQICPRCFGSGSVRLRTNFAGDASGICDLCGGKGTVQCQTCSGKGKTVCPDCGGKGTVKGGCPLCKGSGRVQCNHCLGTGLRPPENYSWGPYPELPPGSAAGDGPIAFQGKTGGTVITVLPSHVVFGGRLALYLDKRLGSEHFYLLLCVDNRKSANVVSFDASGRSLRIVTPDARQVEMLEPAPVAAALRRMGADKNLLAAVTPSDALPGVVRHYLCVFPAGTALKPGTRMFWGTGDVWELDLVDARSVTKQH
ncbi:MAG: hypothetical protein JW909_06505 [Planctomycetes bacterium]|nr:hypothetical protein [Planctomycetota bacterium]